MPDPDQSAQGLHLNFQNSNAMTSTVYILNGPNLNLLGMREPHIYGDVTLDDIKRLCETVGEEQGLNIVFRQTNYEGQLVDWIQEAREAAEAIIINAAAYTHTSVAIHDALKTFEGIKVELHISNPHMREPFRHLSYVSSAVDSIAAGLGYQGYPLVVETVARQLNRGMPSSEV